MRTLNALVEAARRMEQAGTRAILGTAAHPNSLDLATRRRMVAAIAAELRDEMRRHCLAEIVGLPPDASEVRIFALVAMLKRFFRRVGLRAALDDRSRKRFC